MSAGMIQLISKGLTMINCVKRQCNCHDEELDENLLTLEAISYLVIAEAKLLIDDVSITE